jgi:hypothetical protein
VCEPHSACSSSGKNASSFISHALSTALSEETPD